MTISPKILVAIQKAGNAVFNADAALKGVVADSAKKVSEAMAKNPMDGQHDELYQNWKNAARISQAMSAIETELKNLYALAAAAPTQAVPALSLAAPRASEIVDTVVAIDVTDVVAKRALRKLKTAKKSAKKMGARAKRSSGQDNTQKVLAQLQTVLNDQTFTKINQSSVAEVIGLPKGSIGASVRKLIQEGKLVQGAGKEFKLATASPQ